MKMKKGLLTMLALLSMGSSAFAQGTVNVPTVTRNVNGEPGPVNEVSVVASRQGTVKIELTEFTNYRDLQFDLTLPEGITVVTDENEVIQVETAKTSHKVAANAVADNKVRFVVYNEGNVDDNDNVIKLGNGIIVEIPVNVAANFKGSREPNASLDGIKTSDDAATTSIDLAIANFNVRAVLLGDINDNGEVEIGDATCVINNVVGSPNAVYVEEVADVNGQEGPGEIGDATSIVNIVVGTATPAKRNFNEEVGETLDPD